MGNNVKLVCYDVNGNQFAASRVGSSVVIHPIMNGRPEQVWVQHTGSSNWSFSDAAGQVYLNYTADNSPCAAGGYDPNASVWNPAQSGQAPDGSVTYALRPILSMGNQNLNALGGSYSGDAVGTWDWGGGANNEVWEIMPA